MSAPTSNRSFWTAEPISVVAGEVLQGEQDADVGVELVYGPVRLDPRVRLGTRLMSPRWVSPPSPRRV